MTEPMSAAEEAAFDIISREQNDWPWGTVEELARDIVAAVRPILDAEREPTDDTDWSALGAKGPKTEG